MHEICVGDKRTGSLQATHIITLWSHQLYMRPDTLRRIPESLVFGIRVTITTHHLVSTTIVSTRDRQTKAQWLRQYGRQVSLESPSQRIGVGFMNHVVHP